MRGNQKPIHRRRCVLNFCLVPKFLDPIWKQFGSVGTETALFLDEGTDPTLSSSHTVLFDFGVLQPSKHQVGPAGW